MQNPSLLTSFFANSANRMITVLLKNFCRKIKTNAIRNFDDITIIIKAKWVKNNKIDILFLLWFM